MDVRRGGRAPRGARAQAQGDLKLLYAELSGTVPDRRWSLEGSPERNEMRAYSRLERLFKQGRDDQTGGAVGIFAIVGGSLEFEDLRQPLFRFDAVTEQAAQSLESFAPKFCRATHVKVLSS